MAMKLPGQFREMFARGEPLSEAHGRLLAEWAKGGAPAQTPTATADMSLSQKADLYEDRLKAATVVHKLRSIRENNQRLRDALDAADPERLADLETLFRDRESYLEEAETRW
ncbi:hypothetical protein [Paraburkholderia fungorum]|uniref:hypothetical protein n=1 Tax=Paraburkholderia fungorum TaxID=134537 RepID=UPI003D6C6389